MYTTESNRVLFDKARQEVMDACLNMLWGHYARKADRQLRMLCASATLNSEDVGVEYKGNCIYNSEDLEGACKPFEELTPTDQDMLEALHTVAKHSEHLYEVNAAFVKKVFAFASHDLEVNLTEVQYLLNARITPSLRSIAAMDYFTHESGNPREIDKFKKRNARSYAKMDEYLLLGEEM